MYENRSSCRCGSIVPRLAQGALVVAAMALTGVAAHGEESIREQIVTPADGAEMVLVPAGPFTMGSGEGSPEESPPHVCVLPAFYIDRLEVTNARYARFVAATGATAPLTWVGSSPPTGQEELPVTNVSWFDAMHYAVWAGKRLPTEAEWEKAARGTDSRRYPWGNKDDEKCRIVQRPEGVGPVGQRPSGTSPYGCMDMGGNAWEWTADWFDAYPGTPARSVHFGKQYKVVRGGGATDFYGVENSPRCSQRARLAPYGDFDALGFRCVKDVDLAKASYVPQQRLDEAQNLLRARLQSPITLSYEQEYAGYLKKGRVPLSIAGASGQKGFVRTGVPFAQGVLKDAKTIAAFSPEGKPRPTQTAVLTSWPDGSARWVLVDFPTSAGESCELGFREATATPPADSAVRISKSDGNIAIDTGAVSVRVTPDGLVKQIRGRDGAALLGGMTIRLNIASQGGMKELHSLPAGTMEIEEAGPLHGVVRLRGAFAGPQSEPSPFRYDLRIHASAGAPRLNLLLTLTHYAKRSENYKVAAPILKVARATVSFDLVDPASQIVLGGDRGTHAVAADQRVELRQPDELNYSVVRGTQQMATGSRAPGTLTVQAKAGAFTLGVRHFWQNYPKALFADSRSVGVELWAGKEPFEWEAALAKTHEVVLDFSAGQVYPDPLRAAMAPAWACGSEAVGPILPRGREAIAQFPYWELMRATNKRNWVRGMPFGLRDFGDGYIGSVKGKNAFVNLEYDVPFYFLMDFLRTGETWYLETAEEQVRHQVDIDVDHFTGQQWKHSPQHTTDPGEFGHVFFHGAVLYYLLTGERRVLDVAREVGDWMAPLVEKLQGMNNGRQVGWPLYSLSALYEATGDDRYLKAMSTACTRLAAEQAPTGRLNFPHRWDDRVTFFSGISMSGMLSVYQVTGDERTAKAILATARRTFGFYPEYACRTLNTYCWAAERTKDPRYPDALERTWRTSLAYMLGRDFGGDIFGWQFTWFAAKYGLCPLFESEPESLPDPATWKGVRLHGQHVEVYLKSDTHRGAPVLIVLEGLCQGRAELLDSSGREVRSFDFKDVMKPFQPAAFPLPSDGRVYRLRMHSEDPSTWQVHYDTGTRVTIHDPSFSFLTMIYPRATGFIRDGAKEVKVRLEAIGEGFHSATLYDPDGRPVAAVKRFIDSGDIGRYEMELKARVDDRAKGWALDICAARVLGTEGLLPYWSGDSGELFNPERDEP